MNALKKIAMGWSCCLAVVFSGSVYAATPVLSDHQESLVGELMQQVAAEEVKSRDTAYAQCVDQNYFIKEEQLKTGVPKRFNDFSAAIVSGFRYLRDVKHLPINENTPNDKIEKLTRLLAKDFFNQQCGGDKTTQNNNKASK